MPPASDPLAQFSTVGLGHGVVVSSEVTAKGINFRSLVDVFTEMAAPPAVDCFFRELPPELATAVAEETLAKGEYYPIAWYRDLHAAARAATGEDVARELGHRAVRADFRGVYRPLAMVLSPHNIISRAPRVFGAYYKPCTMYVSEARAGFCRAHWLRCYGFDGNVWQDVIGGCAAVLEASGAERVQVDLVCGGRDGDSKAEITARWE